MRNRSQISLWQGGDRGGGGDKFGCTRMQVAEVQGLGVPEGCLLLLGAGLDLGQ